MSLTVGTDTWITLSAADDFFSGHIGSSPWDALSDTDKEKYLKSAYRWIYYDSAFSVPAASTETAVKYGQCEAALFLINYYSDISKRDALLASGVSSFTYGERREDLTEIKKPSIVIQYFSSVAFYNGGVSLINMENDATDY